MEYGFYKQLVNIFVRQHQWIRTINIILTHEQQGEYFFHLRNIIFVSTIVFVLNNPTLIRAVIAFLIKFDIKYIFKRVCLIRGLKYNFLMREGIWRQLYGSF